MSSVAEVHTLTGQLLGLLSKPIEQEERDTVIELMDKMLNEREAAISKMEPPFSNDEQKQLQELNVWNKLIIQKMVIVKSGIQRDMHQLRKTKAGADKYVNPYQSVQADGMFYDKRK
ncbi:flagellar protein FliT [Bacillus sp. FJAT-42376]|uniref:flagellar protein FliT n=1 Tax=Bacillus sp. FJAT-42376 TaxID=2014076 RepID=UPI000F50962D|nr:flagellar protein FliT [Bacillus sp. FJAT-42376]AZB44510.1 flagellar protein FliT [Bacillus sp. FJAT-42376]